MAATVRALSAPPVRIHRLRLRAAAGAHAHAQQALERVRWPLAGDDEWVFVRRVTARATAAMLAQTLAEEVSRQVQGGSDEVCRFPNRVALLAALLADIARGVADQRWYWRDWLSDFDRLSAQTLVRVMAGALDVLPAVCAALAGRGELVAVWQALDDAAARELSAAIATHGGYRLNDRAVAACLARPARPDITGSPPAPRLSAVLREHWQPVFATLAADDLRRVPALQLIARLAWPLALLAGPPRCLAALADRMRCADDIMPVVTPAPVETFPVRGDRRSQHRSAAPENAVGLRAPSVAPSAIPAARTEGRDTGVTPDREPASAGERDPTFGHRTSARVTAPDTGVRGAQAERSVTPAASAPAPAPIDLVREATAPMAARVAPDWVAGEGFTTSYAGALRLINMLARPQAQAVMRDHAERLPNGWCWVYRLACELALDRRDPLAAFLRARCGEPDEDPDEPPPPLPAREVLLALAARWYPAPDLWSPGLLALEARVQASASHVDVHAALRDVRLDVRLAGLDVDPGWQAWLGCVVRFHHD